MDRELLAERIGKAAKRLEDGRKAADSPGRNPAWELRRATAVALAQLRVALHRLAQSGESPDGPTLLRLPDPETAAADADGVVAMRFSD